MSYQVLEQWAGLGIGAAILPQSKLSTDARRALRIRDKSGKSVLLSFTAVWNRNSTKLPHLAEFAAYLSKIVPAVASGLVSAAAARGGRG
jgi:DNA-binding transcriptional LysR family regulator